MRTHFKATILLLSLSAAVGCHKTRPPVPVAAPPPAAQPQQQPETQPSQPTQQPKETTAEQQQQAPSETPRATTTTAEQPKARHPKPQTTSKNEPQGDKKPAEVAKNVPPKVVIQDGGAPNAPGTGQIAPTLSQAQTAAREATTEQLLETTENNLKNIKRQLSSDEQATVTQIKDFIAQSRQAIKEHDLVRAHNLASKAHLLSDALIKQ